MGFENEEDRIERAGHAGRRPREERGAKEESRRIQSVGSSKIWIGPCRPQGAAEPRADEDSVQEGEEGEGKGRREGPVPGEPYRPGAEAPGGEREGKPARRGPEEQEKNCLDEEAHGQCESEGREQAPPPATAHQGASQREGGKGQENAYKKGRDRPERGWKVGEGEERRICGCYHSRTVGKVVKTGGRHSKLQA